MEHVEKDEIQHNTCEEDKVSGEEFAHVAKDNAFPQNEIKRYDLSDRINELRKSIRSAIAIGKQHLCGSVGYTETNGNLNTTLNNLEMKENEYPFLATAEYNDVRFQNYNDQLEGEIEHWITEYNTTTHKNSKQVRIFTDINRYYLLNSLEVWGEQQQDDNVQEVWKVDDSMMDEYRNPLFNEYRKAAVSSMDTESDNTSNQISNTSKVEAEVHENINHTTLVQSEHSTNSSKSYLNFLQEMQLGDENDQLEGQGMRSKLETNESSIFPINAIQSMSISSTKLLQDLMLKAMEEFYKQRPFKANPVPPSTSQPRYDSLVIEQELRSALNKQAAMELLQELQQPFSFHTRTYQTRHRVVSNELENKRRPFTAKEVPAHVKQMRYPLMLEQNMLRKVAIKKQAELSLKSAKLPPRMELHQNRSKEEEHIGFKKEEERENRAPGYIPNFKNLHTQWKMRLQKARNSVQRKLTIPVAFNIERRPSRSASLIQPSQTPTTEPRSSPDLPNKIPIQRKAVSSGNHYSCSSTFANNAGPAKGEKSKANDTQKQENISKMNRKKRKMQGVQDRNIETHAPYQYVRARYKQIERQAKEIVAEVTHALAFLFEFEGELLVIKESLKTMDTWIFRNSFIGNNAFGEALKGLRWICIDEFVIKSPKSLHETKSAWIFLYPNEKKDEDLTVVFWSQGGFFGLFVDFSNVAQEHKACFSHEEPLTIKQSEDGNNLSCFFYFGVMVIDLKQRTTIYNTPYMINLAQWLDPYIRAREQSFLDISSDGNCVSIGWSKKKGELLVLTSKTKEEECKALFEEDNSIVPCWCFSRDSMTIAFLQLAEDDQSILSICTYNAKDKSLKRLDKARWNLHTKRVLNSIKMQNLYDYALQLDEVDGHLWIIVLHKGVDSDELVLTPINPYSLDDCTPCLYMLDYPTHNVMNLENFALFVLFQHTLQEEGLNDNEDSNEVRAIMQQSFGNPLKTMVTMFYAMIGTFEPQIYHNSGSLSFIITAMFVVYLAIQMIVMVNMLIAIIGDTFDRVKSSEEDQLLIGRARFIDACEAQLSNKDIEALENSIGKYLYVLFPKDDTIIDDVKFWQGRVKTIEDRVGKMIKDSQKEVMKKIEGTNIDIKKNTSKLKEMKEDTKKMKEDIAILKEMKDDTKQLKEDITEIKQILKTTIEKNEGEAPF
eukprot:g7482.t1